MVFTHIPHLFAGLLCLLCCSLYSQNSTFQKNYRGLYYATANDILETTDGYLIAGETGDSLIGGSDALLISTDKNGAVLWKKTYGYFGNDVFSTVIAANDGGFLAWGYAANFNVGYYDCWLVKLDNEGNLLWQKTIGAIDTSEFTKSNIIAMPDGYVLSGQSLQNHRTFVTRVNNNGETMWSRITPAAEDASLRLQYMADGLLYLTGTVQRLGCWRTMDPATGAIVQSREYQLDDDNFLYNMHRTPQGDHLMTGGVLNEDGGQLRSFGWVQKVNSEGQVIWAKAYRIADRSNGITASAMLTDGSCILTTRSNSIDNPDVITNAMVKIDANGTVIWARNIGSQQTLFSRLAQTADGGFMGAGYNFAVAGAQSGNLHAIWLKTDSLGYVDGCCITDLAVTVEDVVSVTSQLPFSSTTFQPAWAIDIAFTDTAFGGIQDFCFNGQPTVSRTVTFCPNQSVTLGDSTYNQSGIVELTIPSTTSGCDTLATYTLELLEQPVITGTITFNPGQTVTLGDSTYSQSSVVTITLPSVTGGCDTLATYTLELLDSTNHQITTFLQEYKGLIFSQANDVLETAEGYLIAGATITTDIDHLEAMLVHINKSGTVLWKKTYTKNSQCKINRLIAANDGGYLLWGTIAGTTFYEAGAWLAKIDNDGNLIWQKFLSMQTDGTNIIAIPDGYILSGGTETNVGPHYYSFVTRVDNNGNTLWSRSMPSPVDNTLSVQYVADSLLYLTGHILFGPPSSESFACWRTMDIATGSIVQSQEYKVDTLNIMYTMHRTPEGNHIMTGSTSRGFSGSIPYNGWVQKVNSAGEVLWSKTYKIGDGMLIYASEMLADGSLVLAMNVSNYVPGVIQPSALVKIDAQGAVVWARNFEGVVGWSQIRQTDDGGFFITGYKPEGSGALNENAFWMKTDSLGIVADCCVANATVIVADVSPTTLQIPFEEEDFGELSPYDFAVESPATGEVEDFCFNNQPKVSQTLTFCSGQSVTLGDSTYSQSAVVVLTLPSTTGGCDTLATYHLELLEQFTRDSTIAFCSGEGVTLGDSTYSQPGVVNVVFPSSTGSCDSIITYTLEFSASPVINRTIAFCPGTTVTLGDSTYNQPGIVHLLVPANSGGCDTLITYTLEILNQPTISRTISFCPGETVALGDSIYSQPTSVTITIPALTGGCDTIATYTLQLLTQPTVSRTIAFCPGETVILGGAVYTQPGIVTIVIPALTSGCDTIATYTLVDKTVNQPNTVQLTCPANIATTIPAGNTSALVNYTLPTATSDCPCPGMLVDLSSGGASGSLFPLGINTVCYRAEDACGHEKTCCFTIQVEEGSGCDEKVNGCLKFELLTVQRDINLNWAYRVRITNNCSAEMTYAYIEVPTGIQAISPADNSIYHAPGGYTYLVRNPNFSPFYSLRFKPVSGGLLDGQSDVFRYVLPAQVDVDYIHVAVRLTSDVYYEAYLNTFSCPIGSEYMTDRAAPINNDPVPVLTVFPNPAAVGNNLSISGKYIPNGTFLLQDVMGRSILECRIVDNQVVMDKANVTAGVYFFKIIADGQFIGSGKISLF